MQRITATALIVCIAVFIITLIGCLITAGEVDWWVVTLGSMLAGGGYWIFEAANTTWEP